MAKSSMAAFTTSVVGGSGSRQLSRCFAEYRRTESCSLDWHIGIFNWKLSA